MPKAELKQTIIVWTDIISVHTMKRVYLFVRASASFVLASSAPYTI